MIKKGLKNYFINLKYYFTPLGVLALGVILSLAIALPVISSSVHGLVDFVTSLDVKLDFSAFLHKILDAVLDLNWRSPAKALTTMLNSDWLNKTFSDSIFALVPDAQEVAQEIIDKVNACVSSIKYAFMVVLVFAVVGIIGGYFLTKFLIRREIAKRALWKSFLVSLIDAIVTAGLPVLSVYLSSLWEPSVYFVTVFLPLIWGFILLMEAYVVHGLGKVKLKKIVTLKNSAKLLLTNILVLLISSAFHSIISAIAGGVVGLLVGLPFVEIALIVCGLNAESYVKETADRAVAEQALQQEEPQPDSEQKSA
ncbi:MAG: hypothetical protein K2L02_01255 [Clostridia bacterium]|nr:hypothetical protein [Clostridia bacterium]